MRREVQSSWIRWAAVAGAMVAVLAFLLVLTAFPICSDWAFICENTGSRKGYREWFLGLQTNKWYEESKLEDFVKKEYPNEFQHRWTSYQGTGRNIFGIAIVRRHGRPGPILMPIDWLNGYVDHLDPDQKKGLYDVFKSDDPKEVRNAVDKVGEFVPKKGMTNRKMLLTNEPDSVRLSVSMVVCSSFLRNTPEKQRFSGRGMTAKPYEGISNGSSTI